MRRNNADPDSGSGYIWTTGKQTYLCAEDIAPADGPLAAGDDAAELESSLGLASHGQVVHFRNGTGRNVGHTGDPTLGTDSERTEQVVSRTAEDREWSWVSVLLHDKVRDEANASLHSQPK